MKNFMTGCLLVLIAACGPTETDDSEGHGNLPDNESITLEETAVLNQVDDVYFSFIRSLLVTSGDEVLLNDAGTQAFLRLDSDGNFAGRIGREGRGPAEFADIRHALLAPGDTLHVFDRNNARHQVFARSDEDWLEIREITLKMAFEEQPGSYFPQLVFEADGKQIGHFRNDIAQQDTTSMYHCWFAGVDHNLAPVQSERVNFQPCREAVVIREENSVFTMSHPFGFELLTQIDRRDGTIHQMRNDEAVIRVMEIDGTLLREIPVPFEKVEIDEQERKQYLDRISEFYGRSIISKIERKYLDYQPFIRQFVLDDQGRYWMQVSRTDPDKPNWIVLDADGNLAGSFYYPHDTEIGNLMMLYEVRNNRLFAFGGRDGEPMFKILSAKFE